MPSTMNLGVGALLALIVVSAPLAGCSARHEPSDPTQPVVATDGQFEIVVPQGGSTGYHWELMGELPRGYTLDSRVYESHSSGALIEDGGGGVEIWAFHMFYLLDGDIVLGNHPPDVWPGDDTSQVIERKTFHIVDGD